MAPKVGRGLRDYAHAHLQFLVTPAIGLFGANGGGLVNGAQVLLNHLCRDDEVAASFRVERHVSRSTHGVETAGPPDQGEDAALVLLQKSLVTPVRARAPSGSRVRGVNINQTTGHATNRRIRE